MCSETAPVLLASNRGYRYGDGLFETMRLQEGVIRHLDLHMDRLSRSLKMLDYYIPPGFTDNLSHEISLLATHNNCLSSARVRLSVFRGNGDLIPLSNDMDYVIECRPLPEQTGTWKTEGLNLGLFSEGRKSTDRYSNLKSANALLYAEAARYAAINSLDDCLVLNSNGEIADTSIANVFIIRENKIITPGLSQGCVDGVMRRYLIGQLNEWEMDVREAGLTLDDIHSADECFLTNAVRGIQWVSRFYEKKFGNTLSRDIYDRLGK